VNEVGEDLPIIVLGELLTSPNAVRISSGLEGAFVFAAVDAGRSLGSKLTVGDAVGESLSLEEIVGGRVGPTLGILPISAGEELEKTGTLVVGFFSGTKLQLG
jgi:hypothetical protein